MSFVFCSLFLPHWISSERKHLWSVAETMMLPCYKMLKPEILIFQPHPHLWFNRLWIKTKNLVCFFFNNIPGDTAGLGTTLLSSLVISVQILNITLWSYKGFLKPHKLANMQNRIEHSKISTMSITKSVQWPWYFETIKIWVCCKCKIVFSASRQFRYKVCSVMERKTMFSCTLMFYSLKHYNCFIHC
jgi:hypothetical protein